jgi:hypothetical protein
VGCVVAAVIDRVGNVHPDVLQDLCHGPLRGRRQCVCCGKAAQQNGGGGDRRADTLESAALGSVPSRELVRGGGHDLVGHLVSRFCGGRVGWTLPQARQARKKLGEPGMLADHFVGPSLAAEEPLDRLVAETACVPTVLRLAVTGRPVFAHCLALSSSSSAAWSNPASRWSARCWSTRIDPGRRPMMSPTRRASSPATTRRRTTSA